ncbi:hypothetical protein F8388_024430 [Cannabis sativa]|uniref:Uncharacterized protein n=1 Tax=Cannabis sativa TaxID=3483 RepID=A0A7J6EJE5_CANSA|nr:hypothetical protein F8388_024430 [Cannabis sativa]
MDSFLYDVSTALSERERDVVTINGISAPPIGVTKVRCSLFLEKLDDGIDPALEYGPCMEGSALPRSSYDRYRQDFSKSGPWPFITRLARNTINPIITHPTQPPALPRSATDQEKCLPSNGSPASLHQQLPTSNTTLVASASVTQLQHQRMPTLNAAIATSGSPHAKKLSTADSRANLDVPGANCTIDFKGKAIDRSKEFPPGYLPQKAIIVPVATPPAYIHCNSAATSLDANLTNAAKLPSTFTKRQMVNQGGNISVAGGTHRQYKSQFHFEKIWLNEEEALDIINKHWTNASSDPLLQIKNNLSSCSSHLQSWHRTKFGGLPKKIHKEVIIKVEGRGEFRCPKMIECNSVCQGYPNCCVNGQCLCEPCRTLLPQPLESSSPPEN